VPGKQKWHPVEKPTSLLRQLIETSTAPGEVVLDFFGGSGSTAHAAIELGRNFLTVEKDEGHHAAIIHRLTALVEGKPTSPPSSSSSPKSSKPKGADLPTTDDEDEELWEEAFSKRGK
jgi:hypothetical protein